MKCLGVSYEIDAAAGMAYISGKVNAKKILKRIVKAGKKGAEVYKPEMNIVLLVLAMGIMMTNKDCHMILILTIIIWDYMLLLLIITIHRTVNITLRHITIPSYHLRIRLIIDMIDRGG